MMKKPILIICSAVLLMLSGCTKSNIVNSETAGPIFGTQQGIVLDWGQIGNDLDEQFVENEEYPMGISVNYSVNADAKTIDVTLMVKEGTTPEEAVTYANAVVRGINDEAAIQDFSYAISTEDTYGGFFDTYAINLIVMPDGMMTSQSLWLVEMSIPAGSNEKIVPREGAKAMETAAEEDMTEEEMDSSEETEPSEGEETAAESESVAQ